MKINLLFLIYLSLSIFHHNAFAKNLTTSELSNCKIKIAKKLYSSQNTETGADFSAQKITNTQYSKILANFFDHLPEIQKRVFCEITRIQIHDQLRSVAFASVILDENRQPTGNVIGIKLQALLADKNSDIFSWKEQLSFGLSDPHDPYFTTNPKGPKVKIRIEKVKNPELFYVLVHEINHLLDFMNSATGFDCRQSRGFLTQGYYCQLRANSYGTLSFPSYFTIDEKSNAFFDLKEMYPLLSKFCFYDCQEFISPSDMGLVYKKLKESDFISTYSITHMAEDFADFGTVYLLHTMNLRYDLKIYNEQDQVLYDQTKHFFDPLNQKMRIKKQWVQNFFDQKNLKYQW